MKTNDNTAKQEGDKAVATRGEEGGLYSLYSDVDRLFDEFFDSFGLFRPRRLTLTPVPARASALPRSFTPRINLSETEKELKIAAELPGLDRNDVTIELDDSTLTIKGEKKDKHEENDKNWHRIEHSYGSFSRVIPLPAEVDGSKAKAKFKKGVLSVVLPKRKQEPPKKHTVEIAGD